MVAPEGLNTEVDGIRRSPASVGSVKLIVRRPAAGAREVLAEAELDTVVGLIGDRWASERRGAETMLTLMNARAAAAVAGPAEKWPPAGDQLFVDLDLSYANLPPGTRLEVGSAMIQVTEIPHRGCCKFTKRFGVDAAKFVNSDLGRELNLRGINARVISSGTVHTGDPISKLEP